MRCGSIRGVIERSSSSSRRQLLRLLAASPLLPCLAQLKPAALLAQDADIIASVAEALNVLDFEAAARAKVSAWHWAWLSTGGDDGGTLRANRDGFERYQLLDAAPIRARWNEHLAGENWGYPLWDVLMLNAWLDANPGVSTA